MSISKLFRPKTLAVSILILILAVAAFGYAAANTVAQSGAGDGTGVVGGYSIGTITYELNGANPAVIDAISFTVSPIDPLTPAATQVRISLDSGSTWVPELDCDGTATPVWTCTFTTPPTVLSVTNLQIVATS